MRRVLIALLIWLASTTSQLAMAANPFQLLLLQKENGELKVYVSPWRVTPEEQDSKRKFWTDGEFKMRVLKEALVTDETELKALEASFDNVARFETFFAQASAFKKWLKDTGSRPTSAAAIWGRLSREQKDELFAAAISRMGLREDVERNLKSIKKIGEGALGEFNDAIAAVDYLLENGERLEREIASGQFDPSAVPKMDRRQMKALCAVQKAIQERTKKGITKDGGRDGAQEGTAKVRLTPGDEKEGLALDNQARQPRPRERVPASRTPTPTKVTSGSSGPTAKPTPDLSSGFWGVKDKCGGDGAAKSDCFYMDLKFAKDGKVLVYSRRYDPTQAYLYNKVVESAGTWSVKGDKLEVRDKSGRSTDVFVISEGAVITQRGRRFEHRSKLPTPPPSVSESSFSKYFLE